MTELAIKFHECIDKYNILMTPTEKIGSYFHEHPTAFKAALIFNHLFRAAMMVGIMYIPHVPLYYSMPLCFVGSLFYRLTVETNCAYKFALPAFAGAAAFMLALPALINIINGVGFLTVGAGFLTCFSFVPLIGYATYILLTVDYDVDAKLGLLPV